MASLGVICDNRAKGMASLGVICPDEIAVDLPELVPAGHWKQRQKAGLWTPLREVSIPAVKIAAYSRVGVARPFIYKGPSVAVIAIAGRVEAKSKLTVEAPATGSMPPMVRVEGVTQARVINPRCSANTPFIRATNLGRVNVLPPIPTVTVMPVTIRRKTYYGYHTPETVQNPTEEMLYFL
jgi:hypothetical protein